MQSLHFQVKCAIEFITICKDTNLVLLLQGHSRTAGECLRWEKHPWVQFCDHRKIRGFINLLTLIHAGRLMMLRRAPVHLARPQPVWVKNGLIRSLLTSKRGERMRMQANCSESFIQMTEQGDGWPSNDRIKEGKGRKMWSLFLFLFYAEIWCKQKLEHFYPFQRHFYDILANVPQTSLSSSLESCLSSSFPLQLAKCLNVFGTSFKSWSWFYWALHSINPEINLRPKRSLHANFCNNSPGLQ